MCVFKENGTRNSRNDSERILLLLKNGTIYGKQISVKCSDLRPSDIRASFYSIKKVSFFEVRDFQCYTSVSRSQTLSTISTFFH